MVLHAGPGNGRGKRLEILPRSGCEERLDRAQRKRAAQQPGRRGRNPACSYPLQLSAGAIAAQRRADRLVRAATYGRLHRRNRRDEARAASACRGPLLRLRPERRPDIARGAEPRHLASPQRAVPQEIRLEVYRYRRGARRLRPLDEDFRGHHLWAKQRARRVRERVTPISHAYSRTQRIADPVRPGDPRRGAFPALLAAGAARRGAAGAGLRAGALEAARGASRRFSRHPREDRADRGVLRPSGREPVVRPQRGGRDSLSVSRMEVRRDRPVHRSSLGAGGIRHAEKHQAELISSHRARRSDLGLPRSGRQEAAGARLRLDARAARESPYLQAAPGVQLPAGDGRRPGFDPFGFSAPLLGDRKPKIFPENSPAGLYIATRRDVGRDRYYWRVTQWLMPCFSFFPPYGGNPYGGHAFVPIDDEHCWTFSIDYHPVRALTDAEREAAHAGRGMHVRLMEGSFIPVANKRNDYLIDRAAQKAKKSFSGIRGVGVQDAAIQESMGPIQDRTREHLVSSDNGIVKTRRRLMDAASAVARGADPPGLDPEAQRARAVSMVVSRELSLREAIAREQRSRAETVSSA